MRRRKFLIGSVAAAGVAATGAAWLTSGPKKRRSAAAPPAEYAGPSVRLNELPADADFDVCVIGCGPAGVVTAGELASAGLKVLIIDAGVRPSDAAKDGRFAQLNNFVNSGAIDYPLPITRAMGIGGTTAIWTGRCPRLLPIDFEPNALTPQGAAWPVSYADIEPFYAQAERTLRVHGDAADYAPRSAPLPFQTEGVAPALHRLLSGADLAVIDSPTSRAASGRGPVRVASDLLPGVAGSPGVTVLVGTMIRRLAADPSGRVTAAIAQDFTGSSRPIGAKAFVLAGGGVESARRLLLSRSEHHPQGLGNTTGLVGRTFGEHPNIFMTAMVDLPRDVRGGQTVRSFQFYERMKRDGFGSMIVSAFVGSAEGSSPFASKVTHLMRLGATVELYPSADNRIVLAGDPARTDPYGDPLAQLHFAFSPQDLRTMERARALLRDIFRRLGAKNPTELPLDWSHHHLGTVRMGADAGSGVVDANLQVHGSSNLFVVSSGVFVTGGASNPTLLITAFAHRLGAHLRGRFGTGGFA